MKNPNFDFLILFIIILSSLKLVMDTYYLKNSNAASEKTVMDDVII